MANNSCIGWKFSGSEAAKEASAASLTTYTSKLFALCDPQGKPILPPRGETAETCHTAEKAVVKAVLCGTGNAYAPEYLNRDAIPKKLTPEDVFMTVGCKQAIELAVDILANPKANVLLPSPGYPWDFVNCILKKLEVRRYEFLPEKNYEINFESVRKQVDKNTFAIFITNPHNPNGNIYSEAHLEQIALLARELGIMVVSDEVFRWTVFGSNPFVPMAKFSSIVPVMALGSISKGWTVPGWRTGWVALHDLDGVFKCTKVLDTAKQFLEINSKPPTVIQAAIPTILKDTPIEFFHRRQSFLKDKADLAISKLKDIPSLKCYLKPEACTFLWTQLKISSFVDIKDDEDFCEKLATEQNLILLPGIAFGLRGWARHSIDMDTLTLEDAFKRLKSFYFFHRRQMFLKDKADLAYSKLADIPSLKCYLKPEACTFLWTQLEMSSFLNIKDDEDFCEKLATEENLVLLPGIGFGLRGWARHSIDMDTQTLEDAFERLKSFCDRHSGC
ncbi:hypothetical protein HID58_078070 [Brassica napus]|uniref:Aminotransferase class I/classII large domain-containing protein n=1 Tax=Brassica napus TaxID=3708 RepID=A0ABQ7YTK9_BRANA|nr:hypothetical protein HID58_078070 [Brassica napus]